MLLVQPALKGRLVMLDQSAQRVQLAPQVLKVLQVRMESLV